MARSCPDCSEPIELSELPTRLFSGSCSHCGHTVTLVEGPPVPAGTSSDPAEQGAGPAAPTLELACPDCHGELAIESATARKIEAVCADCEETFVYALARPGDEEERPRRAESRGGPIRSEGRPCRECGGQLRFSSGEDGTVVGECSSCGNRFTLPPRRDGGRGGPPFRRGGGSGYRPRYSDRRTGGSSRPPPGGNRRYGGPRRDRRSSDGDGDDYRRRRRPSRD